MKTLILYGSKHGTTEDVVNKIVAGLKNPVDVVNIEKNTINLEDYQQVVIGSSIYVGQMNKQIKKFVKENESVLKTKKLSVFLCRGQ